MCSSAEKYKLRNDEENRQVRVTELSFSLRRLMPDLSVNIDVFDQAHQTQANVLDGGCSTESHSEGEVCLGWKVRDSW